MKRKRGRPVGLQEGELRRKIIDAAAEEFASVGYAGARIEKMARAAGCDRALLYFYFRNKECLFQAVLDAAAEHRAEQMPGQPASLAEGLVYWFGRNMAEPQRIRLVMQEALAETPDSAPPSRRVSYLDEQLEVVKAFQAGGLLREDMNPRHLLTAILALTSFPATFPKVASVALDAVDEASLHASWSNALRQIAELLSPPASRPD